ncbi:hypothetical protein RI367_000101 [Sorochytrium milnesiophthora]
MPSAVTGTPALDSAFITPVRARSPRDLALDAYSAMYSVDIAAQRRVLHDYFDVNATFEDPMLYAYTAPRVRTAFASLAYAFSHIEPRILSITESPASSLTVLQQSAAASTPSATPASAGSSAGYHVVLIDAVVAYTLRMLPFVTLNVRTLTKYSIHPATNKIVAHEDVWSVTDLINSVPLVGGLYSGVVRPLAGSAIDTMMRVIEGKPAVGAAGAKNY